MRLIARATLVVAAAPIVVLPLAACSSTDGVPVEHVALQSYSCCSSEDIDVVRHPGETMKLHWIATPLGPSAVFPVSTVRLSASLSGPSASVSALKASTGPDAVTAPVILTTDQVGEAPVSVIVIPKTAPAGFYNLTTTIDQDGGQRSGGTIIQVTAK